MSLSRSTRAKKTDQPLENQNQIIDKYFLMNPLAAVALPKVKMAVPQNASLGPVIH